MKANFLRTVATLLCFIMVASALPLTGFAASNYDEQEGDYYNLTSQKDWDLAPGITESEIVLNNKAGDRRQVMHVVEVDINNQYTKVIPSSKGMANGLSTKNYGVQIMSEQAAYAEANGYGNVVAAMNISLSWYDSTYYHEHPELVGEPLGYLILDGVQYTNSQGKTSGVQTCLVINFDEKDGTPRPTSIPKVQIRSTSDSITGWEEQLIPANFGFLVKDGKMVNSSENHTSEGASRSMLGVKADGTIVMVMNDGRQAPYSTGFNDYEMSEAMLKLGCVYAINGDGGGSSQFLSQRPGEELELHCSPSDGAPRATTHGVLVISTAPSDGEFARASVTTESQYYTPGSTVQFNAVGADLAGGAAEIPMEAYWELSDDSMGSITSDGKFVSGGKTGAVTAKLMYDGEMKGSATINIVVPTEIAFGTAKAYTVPFNKSIDINVTAKYGVFDVQLKQDDYTIFVALEEYGTLNGTTFTAAETEGTTSITVQLKSDSSITSTIPLTIGKASDVIFDFESGSESADLSNWQIKGHSSASEKTYMELSIVTSKTGMVHNGNSALAIHMPMHKYVYGGTAYCANSITWVGDRVALKNATAIGMWIYIPEEATNTEISLNYVWYNDKGVQQRTTPDLCLNDDFNEIEYSGWYYLSVPIDKEMAYIEDAKDVAASQGFKRNFFLKFYVTNSGNAGDETSYMGDITYYIDDVTVDYSSAIDDRISPVFSGAVAEYVDVESEITLSANSTAALKYGNVRFEATVSDNIAIDTATARVYVDGKEYTATYKNGKMSTSNISLCAGTHRIVFEIADTVGNVGKIVRYVTVSGTDVPVSVVPHDTELETALTGSVYWVDIVANEAEKVKQIKLKLDLDTMHTWEIGKDGAVYAELVQNYDIEYYFENIADENDNMITVVLTNTGSSATGKTVIAKLPIRVWSFSGNEDGSITDPASGWSSTAIPAVSVNVETELGEITYRDNSTETFSAEKIHIDTEAYTYQEKMDTNYFKNHTYHVHTVENLDDLDPTCTESGYTGRTFCAVCNSPVDWGTILPANGHDVSGDDGLNTCGTCDKTFYYIDGVTASGWILNDGNYYYADATGEAADGMATIDGHTYTFVNHVLTDAAWENDGVGLTAWWAGEQIKGGDTTEEKWKTINNKKYYFIGKYASTGMARIIEFGVAYWYYVFDDNGVWQENLNGLYDGVYNGKAGTFYVENGRCIRAGLVCVDGDYYYINSTQMAVKNTSYYITITNDLLPAGTYTFDADGKMFVPKNGIVKDDDGEIRYYVNDVATRAGLVKDENGNYYYFNSTLKAVKNTSYYITITNGLLPEGTYTFDAEGKMYVPKNGIVKDDDGEIRYYVNDVATRAGLVKDEDGNYYYFNSTMKAVKNTSYYITITNDLLPAGTYIFGTDGKMLNG